MIGIPSIRQRIRLAVVLPALLPALAVVILVGRDRLELLERDLRTRAALAGERWKDAAREALARGDDDTLQAILEVTTSRSDIAAARVLDAGGAVTSMAESAASSSVTAVVGHWVVRGTTFRAIRAPPTRIRLVAGDFSEPGYFDSPAVFGSLEVIPATGDAAALFLTGMLPVIGLTAGLMVITLLVAEWLAASVIAPVTRLTAHVGQLRFGQLHRRIRSASTDELGALAAAVNRMASSLARSQKGLDDKVRQTTSELHQTLRAVETQNVELDVARRHALEANRMKSEFLANVSHEIRTPINGIVGFVDLLESSSLDGEQRDYVATIRESCINLLAIVNDVLDFSKLEAGKLVIDNVPFDFRDALDDVLSLLAPSAYGRGLELSSMIYADVPVKLFGDPIRIRQVITNLTHNAIKFTGPDQGAVAVRLMVEDDSDTEASIRVQVSDDGIGLSETDQRRLFQPFVQVDSSLTRHYGGTGLGLIICRKLVEQMGGDIGVDSVSGQGSTFWFSLRLRKQPGGVAESEPRWRSPLQGRHILVIDSQPLSRLSIQHLLESWQARASADPDPAATIAQPPVAQWDWDALVIGLTRRELGSDLALSLLARARDAGMPVLVLASTVDRGELRQLLHQGASASLPKAVRRQTVYRELCRLLTEDAESSSVSPGPGLVEEHPQPSTAALPWRPSDGLARRVLVVDDNAINRKLMTTIVHRAGARADEAVDGGDAVRRCLESRFDLVFMDLHMPGMDGYEATQSILERLGNRDAPRIVGLTANAGADIRRQALAAGMSDCLVKPVSEEYLAEVIGSSGGRGGGAAARSDDGDTLRENLRRMLRSELPEHRQRVRAAYRSGDLAALREAVHQLHGGLAVARLPRPRQLCQSLEEAIDSDERVEIPGIVARLLTNLAELERTGDDRD